MPQPWEIENFLEVCDGQLQIDGVSTVELAREYGTPLFVFSESRICHNIARVQHVKDVIGCPLKVCYAAKAMSTMAILRAVMEAGADIEVNSGGELWKALKAGFRGDQIIFNGTSKEVWEIEDAINAEIYAMQVDSLYELSLIEETAKRLGKRANVSLRLVPEIETDTHSGLQTALLTSKFGMMPEEAFSAFRDCKDSPHLNLCGIHLHIGSQNPDPTVYSEALTMLFQTLRRINTETGIKLQHINLGGGFPVNYSRGMEHLPKPIEDQEDEWVREGLVVVPGPDGSAMRLPVSKELSERVARRKLFGANYFPSDAIGEAWKVLRELAQRENALDLLGNLAILLEPGRSIIADAGICLASVRNRKERPLREINDALGESAKERIDESMRLGFGSGAGMGTSISGIHSIGGRTYDTHQGFTDRTIAAEHWLLTDAGFNILLSMETYKWYYHLVSANRSSEDHSFPYKVAGPLCDGGDVYFDIEGQGRLPDHRLLPKNVKPGEVLALLNCGAYSLAQASQYNGRFLPAVVLIRKNGEPELIRKRDGFADLIGNDIF